MAAAEVLAFAASDGWHAAPSFSRTTRQGGGFGCRRDNQIDIRLQSQLSLISEAWIQLRSSPVSFHYHVRPCLDTTHRLFLSYRGHGPVRSLFQRSEYLVRAAAVYCNAAGARSWRPLLSLAGAKCQHSPVELALRLSKVQPCDGSFSKLILTGDLYSSPPTQKTAPPTYSSSPTSARRDGRAPNACQPHPSTIRNHPWICATSGAQIRLPNFAAWAPRIVACLCQAPKQADSDVMIAMSIY